VIEHFRPLLDAATGVALADPQAAEAELRRRLDPDGAEARALAERLRTLLAEGAIADRGAEPVLWSRVTKACEATGGFSIDVVRMSGAGPRHRHPRGEIDYCLALSGRPTFDGRPPGWVVLGEGSEHAPTVAGGSMLVVYLLPEGSIEFLERP
jgi:hypothetical protein